MIKNRANIIAFFICILSPISSYGMRQLGSKATKPSPIIMRPTPTQPQPKPRPIEPIPTRPTGQPQPTQTSQTYTQSHRPLLSKKSTFEASEEIKELQEHENAMVEEIRQKAPSQYPEIIQDILQKIKNGGFTRQTREELKQIIEEARNNAPYVNPEITEPLAQDISKRLNAPDDPTSIKNFQNIFEEMTYLDLKAIFVDPSATACIEEIKEWEKLPSLSQAIKIVTSYPDGSYMFFDTTDSEPYPAIIHNLSFYSKYSNPTIVSLYSKIPKSESISDYDGSRLLTKRLEDQANKFFKSNINQYKQIIELAKSLHEPEETIVKPQKIVDSIESGEQFEAKYIENAHDAFSSKEKRLQEKQSARAEKAAEEEKIEQARIEQEKIIKKEQEEKAAKEAQEQNEIKETKEEIKSTKKEKKKETRQLAEMVTKEIEELKPLPKAVEDAEEQRKAELLKIEEEKEEAARQEAEKEAARKAEKEKEEQEIIAAAEKEFEEEINRTLKAEVKQELKEKDLELQAAQEKSEQELQTLEQEEQELLTQQKQLEQAQKKREEQKRKEEQALEAQATEEVTTEIEHETQVKKEQEERELQTQAEQEVQAEVEKEQRKIQTKQEQEEQALQAQAEQEIKTEIEREAQVKKEQEEQALQAQAEQEVKAEIEHEAQIKKEQEEQVLQAQAEQEVQAEVEKEQREIQTKQEQEKQALQSQAQQEVKTEMEREAQEQQKQQLTKVEKQPTPEGTAITQPIVLTPIEPSEIIPPSSPEVELSDIVIPEQPTQGIQKTIEPEEEKEEGKEEKKEEKVEIKETKGIEKKPEGDANADLKEEEDKKEEPKQKEEELVPPTLPTITTPSLQPTKLTELEPKQELIGVEKQQTPEGTPFSRQFESITTPWVPTETPPQYPATETQYLVPTTIPPQPETPQLQPWPIPQPQQPLMQQPWPWIAGPQEFEQTITPTPGPSEFLPTTPAFAKASAGRPKTTKQKRQSKPRNIHLAEQHTQPEQRAPQPYSAEATKDMQYQGGTTSYVTLPGSRFTTGTGIPEKQTPRFRPTSSTSSYSPYTAPTSYSSYYPSGGFTSEQPPQPEEAATSQPMTKRVTDFFLKMINRVRQPAIVLWERLELVPKWIIDHYRQIWGLKKEKTEVIPAPEEEKQVITPIEEAEIAQEPKKETTNTIFGAIKDFVSGTISYIKGLFQ